MNIEQAKRLKLVDVLASLGHAPTVERKGQVWYCSPFRDEQTPSFKVNVERNLWYDFGAGRGGDVIDLIRITERLPDVAAVLARLDELAMSPSLPAPRAKPEAAAPKPPEIKLLTLQLVKSPALIQYMRGRGIEHTQTRNMVQEATYEVDGKIYRSLAFKNDRGGYELRSPKFKGTISPKAITTIEGDDSDVVLFEGFFDYLTYLATVPPINNATAIILNSVGFKKEAVDAIKALKALRVHAFRDNDAAGSSLLEYLKEQLPDIEVRDMALKYAGFNDLNDWHTTKHISRDR